MTNLIKLSKYFKRYSVIIITGGSSGIGSSIIRTILKLNIDAHIYNLSRTVPNIFPFRKGTHFPLDLCDAKELAKTADSLKMKILSTKKGEILLINNSGFGDYGQFPDLRADKQLSMIDLNVRSVVDLTVRLLPEMLERGGTIVNIASIAAFQPTPFLATYGATKAFVRNWSLALNEDLRGSKVRSLTVCPGPTRSNFFRAAGFKNPPINRAGILSLDMAADEVARQTIQAITTGKSLLINGWKNRFIAFFGSKMPLLAVNLISAALLRKLRLDKHKK